jgi:ribA/ribD-fused uncharacterized protein
MTLSPITSFQGEYRWLSNFWPSRVRGPGGLWYETVEHAYVAAKSKDREVWKHVQKLETPGKAKRFGRSIDLRPDWDIVKLLEMASFQEQKYSHPELWEKLKATEGREIIEGNTWGDTFWGQSPLGNGHNHLGKIIMSIRDDITERGL